MSSSNHSYHRVPGEDTERDDVEDAATDRVPTLLRRLTSRSNLPPFFITLSVVLALLLLVTFLSAKSFPSHAKPKFVILMVSDGMGPASLSLARSFQQFITNSSYS